MASIGTLCANRLRNSKVGLIFAMNLKERARQLKQAIPAVFFALKDKDTPVLAKVVAGITVGYALSPIDLIPDFIPLLGYLDDLVLLPVLIALAIKLIPMEVWERSRMLSANLWKSGKPKKWYYAMPIIALWIIFIWLTLKAIWL